MVSKKPTLAKEPSARSLRRSLSASKLEIPASASSPKLGNSAASASKLGNSSPKAARASHSYRAGDSTLTQPLLDPPAEAPAARAYSIALLALYQ
jgi:hypothetical protein